MIAKYYKAVLALLGVLAFGLTSLSAATDFTAVAPTGVSAFIVVAGSIVTGAIAFLKRNKQTVDQVDKAIEAGDFTIGDISILLSKWKQER